MRVFITGGTGTIGTAVVRELRAHNHEVLALARSEASAGRLRAAGAEPILGGLGDHDVLAEGVRRADGVIHLAFSNDFSSPEALEAGIAEEAGADEAIGAALVASGQPFVTCSGTPVAAGRPATENDPVPAEGLVGGRGRTVMTALALADRGVRTSAVRLPRTVHENGRGGFAGMLAEQARAAGVVRFPEDGEQRWPAVHAADAAALFRLALEYAPGGTVWHAVADEGDRVRDIAETIGARLGLPVEAAPPETFGPLGPIFVVDQPASSRATQEGLAWVPTHLSLLEDLARHL